MSCSRCRRSDCPGCIPLHNCNGTCGLLVEADHLDARGHCPECATAPEAPTTHCDWCRSEMSPDAAHVHGFNKLCAYCYDHRHVLTDRRGTRALDREVGL